ncbi:hypothetical protein NDU88_000921 [Pleurodeles waltl]|uniref:HMG box domain-containing protein n=1 Tax=Pleurodeles waltl TaxID=8319 RepID=A0AAV7M6N7_PLEWA|nr:hypothetical protein NDU88_000921 [Pleurodeles waltl]
MINRPILGSHASLGGVEPLTGQKRNICRMRQLSNNEGGQSFTTAKKLGQKWSGQTPEARLPYELRAAKLKEKYDKDVAAFRDNRWSVHKPQGERGGPANEVRTMDEEGEWEGKAEKREARKEMVGECREVREQEKEAEDEDGVEVVVIGEHHHEGMGDEEDEKMHADSHIKDGELCVL